MPAASTAIRPPAPSPGAPSRTAAPPPVPAHVRLPGLTVVLPCFNEAPNVAQAVTEAIAAAERCASAVEVVVVDDGSADTTAEVARGLAARDPRVALVLHRENRGYGAAVRSGIDASRMPWVLLTDGDLQFDLQQLDRMLPLAEGHDLVAGYRIARNDPAHRRLTAAAWNRLVRRTFGVPVRDVDCAFKLVRGPLVRSLPLRCDGAMISTELYARADAGGWRIVEMGVEHRPRLAGEASGNDLRVVLRAFRERRALVADLAGEGTGVSPAGSLRVVAGGRRSVGT